MMHSGVGERVGFILHSYIRIYHFLIGPSLLDADLRTQCTEYVQSTFSQYK
jgi:hypothetical protein